MNIVPWIRNGETIECASEDLLGNDAFCDLPSCHVYVGRGWRLRSDELRTLEIIVIVAATPAECYGCRHGGCPSAGTTDALLVVEAHGRHVREVNYPQSPMSTPASIVVVTLNRSIPAATLTSPPIKTS